MPETAAVPVISRLALRPLFVGIVFLGSFLLFLVQPLVARLALPVLGGSPSVWNTAMLFYQSALLLGYAYAHALQRLPFRTQTLVHLALFAAAALTLPIGLRELGGADTGSAAALWLLKLLALSIGPVFVAVAAQAPLMQAWFARSGDGEAASPWFLYAASNAGSLSGLLAYPFLLEPFSSLPFQQMLWSAGYLLLMGLVGLGGWLILKAGARPPATVPDHVSAHGARPVGWGRRLHWLLLAAVPSGLMLSTTTHITTDIMAMPLLWVLPLAAYLISFILVFSAGGAGVTRIAVWVAPIALLLFGAGAMLSFERSATAYGMSSLLLLLIVATALHGTLAQDRPAASRLTEFYLWMAAGGVVGGLFPALIAPQVFDWVYEHPILLLGAALLLPAKPLTQRIGALWTGEGLGSRLLRILVPPLTLALGWWLGAVYEASATPPLQVAAILWMAAMAILAIGRPLMFAWTLAMLMLALGGWQQIDVSTIDRARQRSFFGIYSVENSNSTATRRLRHGTTLHGAQSLVPERSRMPLTYYAPQSGVGLAMEAAPELFGPRARIGVVGLGTGTLTCYARGEENWTLFEIDPLMVELATDPQVFSFLSQCKPDARIVVGDARLKLADEPAGRFDLLVVDAFSSDAIPLHLLTKEAFQTYRRTLSADGVLLVHVSNRFLDLEPVVAGIAKEMGEAARMRIYVPDAEGVDEGYNASIWIALAADDAAMTRFTEASGQSEDWVPLRGKEGVPVWSDGFASVLPVLKPFWKAF
ncbi:fused MFS/spermidine synthase [Sandaracinobacter sp. RS1-74]|uniref:fused MFS/spermidine synthase n=1 Tax=Sandaracinobacteroides sayramensis TaxID=2913411 RepID=UPI001EDA664D|nr:fused MFS/spermidine synthase [Sandaracinobacteroides sayramensis]MCG2840335.1 fused MFS/spermidine synthase [Sandaracinobacteroides sayramensis]